jgi:WXG100 family type VII secretion target
MPDVQMDYQQMEEMQNAFSKAEADIRNSISAIKGVGGKLQDTFQGDAGTEMQEAINNLLLKKMDLVAQKMKEVSSDLKEAEEDTKKGITNSKSPYGG